MAASDLNLQDALNYLIPLAHEADKVIMSLYNNNIEVASKVDSSPVTKADIMSNELIISSLKARYPNISILSEETVDDRSRLQNDWCFIIDPLDGTKGFIAKNGEFTVNIALSFKQNVVLGVVSVPTTGEVYYGAKGIGSFYEKNGIKSLIQVSDNTTKLRMVRSREHSHPLEDVLVNTHGITDIVYSGSSIKGCLVACGDAEVYYRFGETSEWDTAAMQCIVEQAGGVFCQTDGTPMIYNREDTRNRLGFLAVNRLDNIWLVPIE